MRLTIYYNSNVKYYGYLGRVEEIAANNNITVKKIDISTVKDIQNSFVDNEGKILIAEPLSTLRVEHGALANAIFEKVGKERVIKDDFTAQSIIQILFENNYVVEKNNFTVIGYGKIGKAITDFLLERGKVVQIIPSRHTVYSPLTYKESSVIISTAPSVVDDDFHGLKTVVDCGGAFSKRLKPIEKYFSRREIGTKNIEKLMQHILEGR